MMFESIINFTYYNLYGGMMRGNYYIKIILRFLYFHITITMITCIMYHKYMHQYCIMYPLCCCENEFNSTKLIYIFLV